MCPLLLSGPGLRPVQALRMLPQSLRVHMCLGPAVLKGLVSWHLPPSLALILPSLSRGSLSPEERDLMETSCLQLSVPRFLPLWIMPGCLLYFVPSAAGGSIYDHGWGRHRSMSIAECHQERTYCYVPLVAQFYLVLL